MRLPETLLFLMKSAALGGSVALSAGCVASAAPATRTVAYPDPSQPSVVYLVEDPRPAASPQIVVQNPCVYVPAQQPTTTVATPAEPSVPPQPSTDPDPCLGCGRG